jgi:hypothetical protein
VPKAVFELRFLQTNTAGALLHPIYGLFLPKVKFGLRKPIAIQAAISFNINLPELLL